ncbi:hypothetical protein JCM10207_006517 [Rhodosporidiobolus poonsookiae]
MERLGLTVTTCDVCIIGVGLVGKQVVRQLASPTLFKVFRIVSLSNSKHTIRLERDDSALDGEALFDLLPPSRRPLPPSSPHPDVTLVPANPLALVKAFAAECRAGGRAGVVVDCTSDVSVAELYPVALSSGLSVVTPNKKGFASSSALYDAIVAAQSAPGAGLIYAEATVGAGLPIHTTLRDLLLTGDEIVKIEGVFSGTLSYLFNQFSPAEHSDGPAPLFSEIVNDAAEHGHTEPHPADDLSGADVARKLTILARLVSLSPSSLPALPSLPDGYASVPTQSLIPPHLAGIASPGEFVERFKEADEGFEKLREEARREGKVLRYAGVIDRETGSIRCGLEKYPLTHPFAALSGSHLSIAFWTKRYSQRPLVVQGPGYPLDVTASAVVADLVRVAERHGARLGL